MARRTRLDAELVRRGLARSREQAAALVAAGRVLVRGTQAHKPAAMVDPADAVRVLGDDPRSEYVSRGGHKLAGALAAFGPDGLAVTGRRCLDAGASTGGFTDVLLRAGAAEVLAVDVGYGQLAWSLRNDPRVRVYERTNVRNLTPEQIGGPAALTVADLSFIPLRLVLPALAACTEPDGDLALMVKPQFEVGREGVGPGGVVRDPVQRTAAVLSVTAVAAQLGLGVAGVATSPLPGPSGNVEFFVWFRRGAPPADAGHIGEVVAAGVPAKPVEPEPGPEPGPVVPGGAGAGAGPAVAGGAGAGAGPAVAGGAVPAGAAAVVQGTAGGDDLSGSRRPPMGQQGDNGRSDAARGAGRRRGRPGRDRTVADGSSPSDGASSFSDEEVTG